MNFLRCFVPAIIAVVAMFAVLSYHEQRLTGKDVRPLLARGLLVGLAAGFVAAAIAVIL